MSNFSHYERSISAFLVNFPFLKKRIKRTYQYLSYIIYRKKYKYKIFESSISIIDQVCNIENNEESFFGYYDKCPQLDDNIISYVTSLRTTNLPSDSQPLRIVLSSPLCQKTVALSTCYNWQQGCRAHWIDKDFLIYNDFDPVRNFFCSKLFSVSEECVKAVYDYPVQDSYFDKFYLSINYRRLMSLRPDYGYRNLPPLQDKELADLKNDGIVYVDMKSNKVRMLHTLDEIVKYDLKADSQDCYHKVNHLMINRDGSGFIFIHRYYKSGRRFDRLMYSNFNSLHTLVDENMVSHCCWIDEDRIIAYLTHNEKAGFYILRISTNEIIECEEINKLDLGDGHPTVFNDWVVFDTYPDKSRMQKLFLYNIKTRGLKCLLEVYHPLVFNAETRCDLHPRFALDGKKIFFDSVYSGKRMHCSINMSFLVK